MTVHHSSLATIAQATFNYLDSKGLDAAVIFKDAGLDSSDIFDPTARIPVYSTNRLYQIAERETGEDCIVYRIADYFDITMAHAIGYAWLASRNLQEALVRFIRYHRMLSNNVEISLEPAQGAWQLIGKVVDTGQRDENEGVLVFCLLMCRLSYSNELVPQSVQLTRARPIDPSLIENFYRCNVEYGCPENILVFSQVAINQKQRGANPSITVAMDNVIAAYLAQLDEKNIESQVRNIVARILAHGEPSRDEIAEELKLSPRTLQRRLDEQNCTVKNIIDETRHELAIEFLQHGNYSVKEVAYNLGFSDPSNFSRAFKRWEGVSPKAYRA